MASRFEDDVIAIWDTNSHPPRITVSILDSALVGFIKWSADSKYLAGDIGDDGPDYNAQTNPNDTSRHINIWDANSGKVVKEFPSNVGQINWSPDGKLIAAQIRGGATEIWDAANYETLLTIPLMERDGGGSLLSRRLITWGPKSDKFAEANCNTISGYCFLSIRDATTGKITSSLEGDYSEHAIQALVWHPDGKLLASDSGRNLVHIWNPDTGQLLASLNAYTERVISVDWSSDGKMLATVSEDGSMKVWEITSEEK